MKQVDFNHTDSNQLFPAYFTTIKNSANICVLNQFFSLFAESMEPSASTVPIRTTLAYVPSTLIAQTPSTVHLLYLYPPVPAPQKFASGTSDPPSP